MCLPQPTFQCASSILETTLINFIDCITLLELFVNFIYFHFGIDFIRNVGIILRVVGGTVVEIDVGQLLLLVYLIEVEGVTRAVELLRILLEGTAQLSKFLVRLSGGGR